MLFFTIFKETMTKPIYIGSVLFSLALCLVPGLSRAGDLETLFSQVETLKIERKGYVLGGRLSEGQKLIARENPVDGPGEKVFKFKDQSLNIVADKETGRVLVIYEQFEKISGDRVRDLVGELFMAYEEPTISAHDKLVYWAWGKGGKFTASQFDTAKEKKKSLAILATVKFNSEIKIMEKTPDLQEGDAYYIISSDPLLRHYQSF